MRPAIAALLMSLPAVSAVAETFDAAPVADTYLWLDFRDMNYGSSPHIAVGSGSSRYRDDRFQGLMRWNLPEKLTAATIRAAKIVLAVRGNRPGAGTIDVYLLTRAWSEKATWRTSDGERAWPPGYGALGATTGEILAGADVDEILHNTGGEFPTGETVTFDVADIVKRWAAGSANHGLLFRMVHVRYPQCVFNAYSRNAGDVGLRPRLVIDFEPNQD